MEATSHLPSFPLLFLLPLVRSLPAELSAPKTAGSPVLTRPILHFGSYFSLQSVRQVPENTHCVLYCFVVYIVLPLGRSETDYLFSG